MLIALYLIWIVLNGQVTPEIALIGLLMVLFGWWLLRRERDYTLRDDIAQLRHASLYLSYAWLLLKEIAVANARVIRLVLSPKYEVEPVMVRFRAPLKSRAARVTLANSITLTPGTMTVKLEENEYLIHCLDASLAEGLEDSEFVALLRKMEA